MAIKGLTSTATFPYVSRTDSCRGQNGEALEGATIFQIGSLDGFLKARIKDLQTESRLKQIKNEAGEARMLVDTKMLMYQAAFEACRVGLKGWSNFCDDNGPIPFNTIREMIGRREYDVVTADSLGKVDPDLALELMERIMDGAEPTKVELGNSVAVSLLPNSSPSATAPAATPPVSPSGDVTPISVSKTA